MATYSVFGSDPVEIPANGLLVTHDDNGQIYRIGTLFYTTGVLTAGWRCRGARIYLAADSGADVMPSRLTLSLWVQPTLDDTTLSTPALRTVTIDTTAGGRPGWFEGTWDSVEIAPGQKFMVSYEGDGNYQYVPGSNAAPYDAALQASDGSQLYLSEMYAPNRGFFYDTVSGDHGGFSYYSGLDVLVDDDNTPPAAPTNVTATPSGQTVTLSWTAATDNVGVTEYHIYRGTTAGFTTDATSQIATVGTSLTHDDVLFTSNTYYYKVTARDIAQNESADSNEVSAVVTVSGSYYLYPSDLGWTVGSVITDSVLAGQTFGTLFSLSAPSTIAGLRFYSPANVTNVTARLWGDGGELVVQAGLSFVTGWNVCLFDIPYAGVAGVTYCTSVYLVDSPQVYTGHASMFSATRTQVGAAYSEISSNGVFNQGDVYPTLDFQSTWYGIDAIVVTPSGRTGNIQVWDGNAWQPHPLKVWDGASWVTHPAMGYNGTDFIKGK